MSEQPEKKPIKTKSFTEVLVEVEKALESLDDKAKVRVLEYVKKCFDEEATNITDEIQASQNSLAILLDYLKSVARRKPK